MKLTVQKIFLTISLILLCCTQGQAQTKFKSQFNLIFAAPPPPPDIGEPGKRAEAGSRGCSQDINSSPTQKQLTALVPLYRQSEVVFGTTIAEHPSFLFYVPYTSSYGYGEFVLEDEAQNQTIYKTSLAGTPGVISLRLPATAPLEIGNQYRWYFNIYCKEDNQIIADVEGYVKRKQLNSALKTQLATATTSQRVALYAANGVWYEALSAARELRRSNSSDWAALLQDVGLQDIANEPQINCCSLESQQ